MTTVTRTNFTDTLTARGGYIDLRHMSPDVERTLTENGLTRRDLEEIAGQDRVIRGESEWRALFAKVDGLDHNGSTSSIATTDRSGGITRSGQVYEALRREVDANRARASREGGQRFADDRTLGSVMNGRSVLEEGDRGEHVRRVQQSLIDMGYAIPTHGASGRFDRETRLAVERFQREVGISIDGAVGAETLGALAATAPPPGQQLERSAEYDRMYADGRLDVTIALGADEHGTVPGNTREILSGLRAQGYRSLDVPRMSAADRQRLGLTDDRFDPNAQYFHRRFRDPRSGRDVDTVVRLVTPGSDGAQARRSFEQGLRQDEVVFYAGHARYGTGPDFDDINSGAGNYVIDPRGNRRADAPPAGLRDSIRGRSSDLSRTTERPDYQMLCFTACSTEEYLNNLRDPATFGRDHGNTDIITTTMPTRLGAYDQHALRFLQGITSRESNNTMLGDMSRQEQAYLRRVGMTDLVGRAGHTFTESGFLTNPGNRRIPATSTP